MAEEDRSSLRVPPDENRERVASTARHSTRSIAKAQPAEVHEKATRRMESLLIGRRSPFSQMGYLLTTTLLYGLLAQQQHFGAAQMHGVIPPQMGNFDANGPGMPDCMTDLMRRAVLPNHFVERYVEIFRQQGIDEALLADLPFTDMQNLFINIGISRAGDRIKLFRCFNPVTQQNSMCAMKQCENGGLCRYNVENKHFGCSCTGDFWPPFCRTKKVRDISVVVRELSEDVHRMKSVVSKIGVTYNRWGSTACPAGAELTYVGFMAGSYFSHTGGGANYLCLPFQPLYDRFNSGVQNLGQIAGTEYEFSNSGQQSTSPLQDRNVPCSVCYATGRTSTLMIPARNDCPPKWIVEYTGYLMTAHHSSGNNHRSEYVCVDDHFETLPGYHGNTDGAHLWPVEAGCGIGLDCPPYHAEKELTCAVCTRQ